MLHLSTFCHTNLFSLYSKFTHNIMKQNVWKNHQVRVSVKKSEKFYFFPVLYWVICFTWLFFFSAKLKYPLFVFVCFFFQFSVSHISNFQNSDMYEQQDLLLKLKIYKPLPFTIVLFHSIYFFYKICDIFF